MKIAHKNHDRLVLVLDRQEKELLLKLLQLYPCIPPAHQTLSKAAPPPDAESGQQLLDEALAEQRAQNRKQILAWAADPDRFKLARTRYQLSLLSSEVDWLLQVLNDVRVGSWLRLGSPEERVDTITEENAPHYFAMEAAGLFQMQLLHALEGGEENV